MIVTVILPHRKTFKLYFFRLVHADPTGADECYQVWEVRGGDEPYQITVQITPAGEVVMHCTCADAVYRERTCKHVKALEAAVQS